MHKTNLNILESTYTVIRNVVCFKYILYYFITCNEINFLACKTKVQSNANVTQLEIAGLGPKNNLQIFRVSTGVPIVSCS